MPAKILCSAVEFAHDVAWPYDESEGYYRDLLPWADPYIAQLLRKQESQSGRILAESSERSGDVSSTDEDDDHYLSDWHDIDFPGGDFPGGEFGGSDQTASDSPYEWDAYRFRGRGIS
ncbi:MAG TPA: hypothetical protein VFE24_11770 [Pirellulales bacterium]|nr:hypothetical protein [Pirellulales bacterium]